MQNEEHLHGPNCGHLAIVHVNNTGVPHVGFINEEGNVTCLAPSQTEVEVPTGSLFNVCLESENGKLGFHKRNDACDKKAQNCWNVSKQFSLVATETPCNISSFASSHCSNVNYHDQNHHVMSSTGRFLQHENHLDSLLNDENGDLKVHCNQHKLLQEGDDTSNTHSCHVHGTLQRVGHVMEQAANVTSVNSTPSLIQFMDWLDLFIFANQTSTSIVKITKGFCCKKEIPKLEAVLSQIPVVGQYKHEINLKAKTVTFWHGAEETASTQIIAACNAFKAANFNCEIISLGGNAVSQSVLLLSSKDELAQLEEAMLSFQNVFNISIEVQETEEEKQTDSMQQEPREETPSSFLLKFHHFLKSEIENTKNVRSKLSAMGIDCKIISIGNTKVFSSEILIAKGLCCKKEIPKVELALNHIEELIDIQVFPKQKKVVTYHFENDLILSKVLKSLKDNNFILAEQQPEEVKQATSPKKPIDDVVSSNMKELDIEAGVVEEKFEEEGEMEMNEGIVTASSKCVKSSLSIQGVCCAAEVPSVLSCCKNIPGVQHVTVSVISKQVVITHSASNQDVPLLVAKALTRNEFPSQVLINGAEVEKLVKSPSTGKKKRLPTTTVKWYVILATILWLISWLSYVAEPPTMVYLKYLSVVACALGLPKICLKGLRALRRKVLDVNILMTIAVIGALALQDFHEAASVTIIFSWSDWLEDRATRKARGALQALIDLKPETARTEDGTEIPVEAISINQILVVRSGDKIPVDGLLLSSHADVDESNLTGEARPVTKYEGNFLNAGTLNVSPFWFKMKCTALSEDSAVNRMIRLVEESANSRSPTEQTVEKVAKYYTPIVVLVAIFMASIPFVNGMEVGNFWLHTALTLLVVACPCALIISTPITYVCALAQAAKFGVIVKGGKYLETLAKVNRIASDKTGTLTMGQFEVDSSLYIPSAYLSETEAYQLLHDIERNATHPIAQAILRYCETKFPQNQSLIETSPKSKDLEILPGEGVKAVLTDNRTAYVVGNATRLNMCPPSSQADSWCEERFLNGETVSWLIIDHQIVLGIAASDQLRDSTEEALRELSRMRIPVVVLTGDNAGSGKVLHSRLPLLSEVFTQLSPAEKVQKLTEMKAQGKNKVLMIGDGVNDAPALSACDIGLAMGASAAPLALETADCALMDNDLTKIPRLLRLSKRTKTKIIQNISFSLGLKAVMLGLTLAGKVSLGAAIGVDVGSMLLVTLNGVSLLEGYRRTPSKRKTTPTVTLPQVEQSSNLGLV